MGIDEEYGHPVETGGEFARPEKLNGHLLIIFPIGYVPHIQTRFSQAGKRSDAICCDIVDLDDTDEFTHQPGKVYRSSNLMQSQLIVSLRPFIGKKVLGLITRGVARNGMNPPWIVTDMSGDAKCVESARQWAAATPDFFPTTFSPTPPPVQPELMTDPVHSDPYRQQAAPAPAYYPPAPPAQPTYPPAPPAPVHHQRPPVSPTLESMGRAPVAGSGYALPDQPPASSPVPPTTEELEMLQALRIERERRERAAQGQQGDNPPF
jgi:hypothetical protein